MKKIFAVMLMAVFAVLNAVPAGAGEVDDLKEEVRVLKERLRALEERLDRECHVREEKTKALEEKAAAAEEKLGHLDRHISHMEERAPLLEQAGLTIAADITTVVQGTAGLRDAAGRDPVDGSFSADLEVSRKVFEGRGEGFLRIEAGDGDGVNDELANFWTANGDARGTGPALELTEAWYEHRFMEDKFALTFGKLDLTNYFDLNEVANDERFQFLSLGFVNNAAVEFPANAAGLRTYYALSETLSLGAGVQAGDSDWEDIADRAFGIFEADYSPRIGDLQGNYRVYAWANGGRHPKLADPDHDKKGWGVGTSIDQAVTEDVSLFTRLGWRDGEVYETDLVWSLGAGIKGSKWRRPEDVLGLAWGMAHLSSRFDPAYRKGGEGNLELYYKIYVNKYLELTPDYQLVLNPMGNRDTGSVSVFGIRAQVTF